MTLVYPQPSLMMTDSSCGATLVNDLSRVSPLGDGSGRSCIASAWDRKWRRDKGANTRESGFVAGFRDGWVYESDVHEVVTGR